MPKVVFEVDNQTQIEIEETCINRAISFGAYLTELHNAAKNKPLETTYGQVAPEQPAKKRRGRRPKSEQVPQEENPVENPEPLQ